MLNSKYEAILQPGAKAMDRIEIFFSELGSVGCDGMLGGVRDFGAGGMRGFDGVSGL